MSGGDPLRREAVCDIMDVTDLVVTTRNRPAYLQRTLGHIWDRTKTPYRLTVVDDGSLEVDDLLCCWRRGLIQNLVLKGMQQGAMAALNVGTWASFSDPVVFCDDDVLCPQLEPDWMARGLEEMNRHGELAMLALRHPGAKVKPYDRAGNVVYCKSLGGTFCFVRRRFLEENPLPHKHGNLAKPMEERCRMAHAGGWKIGFLSGVYCQHIGEDSVLTGEKYKGRFIEPIDPLTLEPPAKYAD